VHISVELEQNKGCTEMAYTGAAGQDARHAVALVGWLVGLVLTTSTVQYLHCRNAVL
jgi:hypothetical protein